MKRLVVSSFALVCALAIPNCALAGQSSLPKATASQATTAQATGTITAINGSWFTVQTAGKRAGVVNALVAGANALTTDDFPYVWGGGHAEAGVASALAGAKGKSAKVVGFDCSGSVAAVLSRAGLWAPGAPVPADNGVISELLAQKLIAPGAGKGPVEVTLYDHPGVHIFLNIDGRFFGTSDGGGSGGSAKGGPGWLYDGAPDAFNSAFKQYHVLSSVLKGSTNTGQALTFEDSTGGTLLAAAAVGDQVSVTYSAGGSATMLASALTYAGALTDSGTVTAIASDGSSFTVQAADGSSATFASPSATLSSQLQVGDGVQVTYTSNAGTLTAVALSVTSTVAPVTTQPSTDSSPTPTSDSTPSDPNNGGGDNTGGGNGNGYGSGYGNGSGAGWGNGWGNG